MPNWSIHTPSGTGEDVVVRQRGAALAGQDLAVALRPRQHEDIPLELRREDAVVLLAPADDVAVRVRITRVGGVDGARRARAVVGEGHVDLARLRVRGAPFRPVHFRSANHVGRQAGIHQHVGLVTELDAGGRRGGLEIRGR
jgi:hypothetical protein